MTKTNPFPDDYNFEKWLQQSQEIARLGHWEYDLQSQIIYWSPEVYRIFELDSTDFGNSYEAFLDRVHPDDRELVNQAYQQHLENRTPYNIVHRLLFPDGRVKYVQEQCQSFYNDQDQPILSQGTVQDVTSLKKPEVKLTTLNIQLSTCLQERNQQFQEQQVEMLELLKYSNDLIQVINLYSGRIEYVNRIWQETLGYSALEITRLNWMDIIDPRDHQSCQTMMREMRLKKSPCLLNVEWMIVTRNGKSIPVNGSINCRWRKSQPQSVLMIFRDISDRQEFTTTVENLSSRLSLTLSAAAIGCWDYHCQNGSTIWDDRMYQLYGLFRAEHPTITYDLWLSRLHPQDRDRVEQIIQVVLRDRIPYNAEFRIIRGNNHVGYIKAQGSLVLDQEGNPLRLIGINYDISDRKRTEQMIQQQADRERLLREISQRIRQSLDLQTIFETACQEIRQLLRADRVGIFQFDESSGYNHGKFVAESVEPGFASVLDFVVHDHCFGENYANLYTHGRYHAVYDIYTTGLQNCHIDILAQFQVRSNLVIPLMCGSDLWGLLCIHQCNQPRHWQSTEIDLSHEISDQLAIAIQQASLYEQVQIELQVRQQAEARIAQQLQEQKALAEIIKKIRQSLDLDTVLTPLIQSVQTLLKADRVIVFRLFADGRSKIVEEAVTPPFPSLKNQQWDDEVWSQDILDCYCQGHSRIVPDVMDDPWTDCLREYSLKGKIQSKIVAPILQDCTRTEQHRWVCPDGQQKLWGILVVHACGEKRIWTNSEAELLQQVANQLAIAIQQSFLFQQLQQELDDRQEIQRQLTDRNQTLAITNDQLRQVTRMKDEFLANMSHELRTPLNAILGMTEGLQDEVFGSVTSAQRKALDTIERSASHLLNLINDILDVAKIESGQVDLNCASVALATLCYTSGDLVKPLAHRKNIHLDIKVMNSLPCLWVDSLRIQQILMNLLTNSIKFTPPGGRVILEALPTPQPYPQSASDINPLLPLQPSQSLHYVRIQVRDTGIGIDPDSLDRLFKPFMQIDSSLNRQYTGTGLGLSLVKKLTELHGGQVGLTSTPGKGSCFWVDLPCDPETVVPGYGTEDFLLAQTLEDGEQFTETSAGSAALSCPWGNPEATHRASLDRPDSAPLILLVEDNEANISTITSYLRAKGYSIQVARDGFAGVTQATKMLPNLILMDIQLPGMDGFIAMEKIRQNPNLAQIPIIAITALAMPSDCNRCLAAGANAYIAKPIKLKQLVTTIQDLLTSASSP